MGAVIPLAAAGPSGRLSRADERLAGTLLGLLVCGHPLDPAWWVGGSRARRRVPGRHGVLHHPPVRRCGDLVTPLALVQNQIGHEQSSVFLVVDRAFTTFVGVMTSVALILATHLGRERR